MPGWRRALSGSVRRNPARRRQDGPVDAYAAVVTTGIYCLPTCAGRPRPEHVRPFALAAAAEAAGFRPCLRCRPYRAAPAPLPPGPELVCRAVQLVLAGALDGATEADLAARLAVSS